MLAGETRKSARTLKFFFCRGHGKRVATALPWGALRRDYLIVHEQVAKTMLVSIKATASVADYAFVLPGQLCRRLGGMSHGERGYIVAIGSSLIRLPAQYRLYGRFHACTSSTAQVALRETSKYCGRKENMHHLPAFPFAREPIRGCAMSKTQQRYSRELNIGHSG